MGAANAALGVEVGVGVGSGPGGSVKLSNPASSSMETICATASDCLAGMARRYAFASGLKVVNQDGGEVAMALAIEACEAALKSGGMADVGMLESCGMSVEGGRRESSIVWMRENMEEIAEGLGIGGLV